MNSYNPLFYWNADPVLINLGPISIHWYGLMFALAFIIGLQIMRWIYTREQRPTSELDSLFIYVLLGTIIGARLGHVIFYDPEFYFSQPLEIIKIWRGGLASHGGVVGIIIAVYLYARMSERPSTLWILDRFCMTAALGGAFIRMGNFFNSEIIGHAVNNGVVFVRYDLMPRHPVQLYEASAYLIIFLITFFAYRNTKIINSEGRLLGLFLIILFSVRIFLERFKLPQANYELSGDWTVGQWLSLPLIGVGLWLFLRHKAARQE